MKHIPTRRCVCCRKRFKKQELIRFVAKKDFMYIDHKAKEQQRGYYLCKDKLCISKACSKNIFEHITRKKISPFDLELLQQNTIIP